MSQRPRDQWASPRRRFPLPPHVRGSAWFGRGQELFGQGGYRYLLWRDWGKEPVDVADPRWNERVAFIMLNPSAADASFDDATVRKCRSYADSWGYERLVVANLFPLISTDPKALRTSLDLYGDRQEADHAIEIVCRSALVVCAWGQHGAIDNRAAQVRALIRAERCAAHVLRLAKNGEPYHPLYLPLDLKPQPWSV